MSTDSASSTRHTGVWDNDACERCGKPPLAGGRFCLRHFHDLCENGLPPIRRETCGTNAGYQAHRQRSERACDDCVAAGTADREARKQREEVA